MILNVRKQLWSLACIVLPAVGFALTCIGVYLACLQTNQEYTLRVISAYIMIVLGILSVLFGVFWTMCRMKSKMYQRGEGAAGHIHVYTIERPSSFPPSYEQSQGSQEHPDAAPERPDAAPEFVVVVDGVAVAMGLAPPLYSQDDQDAPDCTWSWEQPPPYSRVEHIQQAEVDAEERRNEGRRFLTG